MVTVIIPAYNIENYIENCLNSVCQQTYSDLEIIVIDDGSKDGTGAILDRLAAEDSRIQVIHKENEGVSVARNTGIAASHGDYVFFFDGDDFMEKETISDMVSMAEEKHCDAVIFGYHRYMNGEIRDTLLPRFEKDLYEGEEVLSALAPKYVGFSLEALDGFINHVDSALYVENPALWHMMCKGSLIRDNHLEFVPGMKIGEDTIFSTEYLSYCNRVAVNKKAYYYLVTRSDSAIASYTSNAKSKLASKTKLLKERSLLTKRIKDRTGYDMAYAWKGTVVMSAIELAFLYGNKKAGSSYKERYMEWCRYSKNKEVRTMIGEYKPKGKGVFLIPFLFLKWNWYHLLFLACSMASLVGFTYERDQMMEGKKA